MSDLLLKNRQISSHNNNISDTSISYLKSFAEIIIIITVNVFIDYMCVCVMFNWMFCLFQTYIALVSKTVHTVPGSACVPVLSATTYASNLQLPFLSQR